VLERSPIIFLTGSGSRRTSVGTARILVSACELRLLQQVDDLELVAAFEVLVADLFQVREGADRLRRLSRDVEAQPIVGTIRLLHDACALPGAMSGAATAPAWSAGRIDHL
jgi:hypothetical protein